MYELDNDPVGHYYAMNPDEEDLLFSGLELRNGMVVLIEVGKREHLVDDPSEGTLSNINMLNRWCRVSNVMTGGGVVGFIATYADGNKVKRVENLATAWYVKTASLADVAELAGPKFRSGVIAGEYIERPNPDGTRSIYIKETGTGDVVEFIVGGFTNVDVPLPRTDPVMKVRSDKTFSELVNLDAPVVDPKAPFFPEENIKRQDPEWAIRNLQKNPPKEQFRDIPPKQNLIAPDPTEGAQDSAGDEIPLPRYRFYEDCSDVAPCNRGDCENCR